MAFDRHMNIVLGDAEEHRKIKAKKGTSGISEEKEEKRTLGLIILRGDSVVSMTIEGPPPPEGNEKAMPGGPGVAKAAGRGMPLAPSAVAAPVGLAGPVLGVGGPSYAMMQPGVQVAAAQPFARGMPPAGAGAMPPRPMGGMGMPPPRGMPLPPGMGMPGMPPGMGMGMGGPPMPPGMPGMPPRGPPGMPGMPGMPPGMGFPPPRG